MLPNELVVSDNLVLRATNLSACLSGHDNIIEQRIIDTASGHTVVFKFVFGTQSSALLANLSKPKYTAVQANTID